MSDSPVAERGVGPHILVVEDEPSLRQLLTANFGFEGYSVEAAADGGPALQAHASRHADLIVLDLMLPLMDGFSVLKFLRSRKDEVPVLMLTARGEEADRLQGLGLGADDYLVKPFSLLELLARVKAILRRTQPPELPTTRRSGPFCFDLNRMEVRRRGGELLDLTSREFRLLGILLSHPNRTHSRAELLQLAWEPDARPSVRTVDVHIANLRRKLGEEEGAPWIATVGGEGYRWASRVETDNS